MKAERKTAPQVVNGILLGAFVQLGYKKKSKKK